VEGIGTLTYLGGGVTESPLREKALAVANTADLTILGIHGPKIKAPLAAELHRTVLVSHSEVNTCYGTTYDTIRTADRFYQLIVFQHTS